MPRKMHRIDHRTIRLLENSRYAMARCSGCGGNWARCYVTFRPDGSIYTIVCEVPRARARAAYEARHRGANGGRERKKGWKTIIQIRPGQSH